MKYHSLMIFLTIYNNSLARFELPYMLFSGGLTTVIFSSAVIIFYHELSIFLNFALVNTAILFTISLTASFHFHKQCTEKSQEFLHNYDTKCKNQEHFLLLKTFIPAQIKYGIFFTSTAQSCLMLLYLLVDNTASLVILIRQ